MPIQLSPLYSATTFAATTRQAVVEGIRTVLLTVGWSDVSGGVGDRKMNSGITPDSLQTRIRLYDPGSGNCARVKFMTVDEERQGIDLFLLPDASLSFYIYAGNYQFIVVLDSSLAPGHFICGGVPYLETILSTGDDPIREAIWCHGNTDSDLAAYAKDSFRNRSTLQDLQWAWQSVNENAWGGAVSGIGSQRLVTLIRAYADDLEVPSGPTEYKNGAALRTPARIMWGTGSEGAGARIRGQLWDVTLIHSVAGLSTKTIFGYTWRRLTIGNTTDFGQPSLWVRL